MSNAVEELVSYWNDIFSSQNPIQACLRDGSFASIPNDIRDKFEMDYYPQPFYGYFNGDMKNDILVPLINPGQIRESELTALFAAPVYEQTKRMWNDHIRQRHVSWSADDYMKREKEFIEVLGKSNWRNIRFTQCKRIVGDQVGFMHTIEFFPFHSASWNVKQEIQQRWLYTLHSTNLAINAIEAISTNHLVKHIMGIGKVWAEILGTYDNKFILEKNDVLRGPKGGIAHRFYKFKVINAPTSLPIVIYSGSAMHFPSNDEQAVQLMRNYLEIE